MHLIIHRLPSCRSRGRRRDGESETQLCLHSSPKTGRDFESLIAELGENRICIAPDTPGYGASDAPPAQPSIADYGRALLALLDRLEEQGTLPTGPVDIIGYHTGATIAAWLARHHPDRVRRLFFISLAAFSDEERAERLENIHVFPTPQSDASNIDTLWSRGESVNDKRLDAEWRSRALGDCLRSGARLQWGFAAVFGHDAVDDLKALTQRTLVLCPNDDLREQTLAFHHHIPDHQLIEWPAGNGFLDLDTAEIIEDFLR